MDLYWSEWLLVAVVVYGIGALGSYAIAFDGVDRKSSKITWLKHAALAFGIWCFGVFVFNVATAIVSGVANSGISRASAHEAAAGFGFESGESYPVQIGSRIDGSAGEGYFYGGIFSNGGSISIQPGSALPVSFSDGERSYILEIPTSQVTFVQDASAESTSIELYLVDAVGDFGKYTRECEPAILSLMLGTHCADDQTYENYEDTQRRGLGPIVSDNFDSATIKLSPDLYQQLLGTP